MYLHEENLSHSITMALRCCSIDGNVKVANGTWSQLQSECFIATGIDIKFTTLGQSALNQVQVIMNFNCDRCLHIRT